MRRGFKAACLGLLLLSGTARLNAAVVKDAHVAAELLTDAVTVEPGGTFWAAVRLVMDPGWHTYWKNPGDSGLATSVEWNLPPGFESAGELRWPAPRGFEDGAGMSYGYSGETFLLMPVRVPDTLPATPITLSAEVRWLACQEVCLPGRARLETTLPADAAARAMVEEAHRRLPLTGSGWKISMSDAPGRIVLRLDPPARDRETRGVRFLPEDPSVARHSGTQFFRKDQDGFYELSVPKADSRAPAPNVLKGLLIAKDGWEGPDSSAALEINLTAQSQS